MVALTSSHPPAATAGPGCEAVTGSLIAEPVATASSLAFVAAAAAILAVHRRGPTGDARAVEGDLRGYAALVAGIGLGSVVQHGPDPAWSDLAHDLPLLATLTFVAADCVADLTGRARRWWGWAAPTAALTPLIVAAPRAGDLAQAGVAAAAVALAASRARAVPRLRRRIGCSLALLVLGASIGTLSRAGGPLCFPESPWQGHAAWHVLAAAALVVLAPVIGVRHASAREVRPAEGSPEAPHRRPSGG
ncbi:hypothetical protein [Georgenia sp. AZ-5]|uniref:hypothetical protein n=1 Tax=Georgenia sp. AZ-5 TaxID=3367526 RepID=UPI0037552CBA